MEDLLEELVGEEIEDEKMSELAYLDDCYAKEVEATVLRSEGKTIVLDKTLFYPVGGGQPTDTGKIISQKGEFTVLNVKKVGDAVEVELDREGIITGDKVRCVLDWNRRYKLMRYHTACHIFSAAVHEATGARITGNQIQEDGARVDFDLENFDREQIKQFEDRANEYVRKAIPITIKNLAREDAFAIPAVFKLKNVLPPSIENIRIIDVPGCDTQACGGTHVANTSEIKGLTVTKVENKGKNNRRIYFKISDT
jgi:misacylated tRNA(Ala) deacylase